MFAIYQELDCQSTHIFLSSDVCFLYSKWIQLLEDKKLFAMFIQNDFQQKLSWLNMFNIWCALTNILYQQNQFPILTIIMTIMFRYAETTLCIFHFCWTHSIIDMSIQSNSVGVGIKYSVQKRVFQKDLEKGCLEVDWSKIHFTRARYLHRIWQEQIQNENVPNVIYEDFCILRPPKPNRK